MAGRWSLQRFVRSCSGRPPCRPLETVGVLRPTRGSAATSAILAIALPLSLPRPPANLPGTQWAPPRRDCATPTSTGAEFGPAHSAVLPPTSGRVKMSLRQARLKSLRAADEEVGRLEFIWLDPALARRQNTACWAVRPVREMRQCRDPWPCVPVWWRSGQTPSCLA